MVALPRDAYAELEKSTGPLQQQGVTIEQREDLPPQKVENVTHKWILAASAPEFTAFEVPDNARRFYPDGAIRAALATVAVRETVPPGEQLSLLPFKIGELSGFHVDGVIPGP
jgi:hypothetical protein